MRIVIAGSQKQTVLPAAIAGQHAIAGMAHTPVELRTVWRRENSAAVVVADAAAQPADWLAVLTEMRLPTVILAPPQWDTTALTGLADRGVQILPAGTPWVDVWAALDTGTVLPATGNVPSTAAPASDMPGTALPGADLYTLGTTPKTPPVMPPAPVRLTPTPPVQSRGVILWPVVGGVGCSTLAATLAAATAALGVKTLLATSDPWLLAGQWHFPLACRDEARRLAEHLDGWVLGNAPAPFPTYDLVVWDAWRGEIPAAYLTRLPVVLVARATGPAQWAAVQLGNELRRQGAHVTQGVLVRTAPSGAPPDEFRRQAAAYGLALEWPVLPYGPAVAAMSELQGHALDTPDYGPAVTTLARQWWPDLPWPALPEKGQRGQAGPPPAGGGEKPGKPARAGHSWLSIEWKE